ncbi:MAG: Dna2/Cas4 domain-containing protein [Flavobacteriales bacterium]|nr:Dna2/Cas4 domain-containing protein [Flavobacteriales bacterium]
MALLSKSSILSGLQCHKRLHLQRNRKELGAEDSGQKLSAIRNGIQTGNLARQYFEGGVLVESNLTGDEREADWLKQTQKLMASDVPFIYEATFLSDDVLVRVDILERKGKVWNVYEVKASTSYKNKHVKDLAVQVKILRKAGLIIRKANLMLINPDYVFRGELDVRKMFYPKNMKKKIADVVSLVDNPSS